MLSVSDSAPWIWYNKEHPEKTECIKTVLAQYLYKLADSTGTDWEYKGVAIASYTVAVLCRFISILTHHTPAIDQTLLTKAYRPRIQYKMVFALRKCH